MVRAALPSIEEVAERLFNDWDWLLTNASTEEVAAVFERMNYLLELWAAAQEI